MKEQNGNEKEKNKDKKKSWFKNEKKFYLFTAVGCAAILLAVIIVAVAVSGNKTQQGLKNPTSSSVSVPNSSDKDSSDKNDSSSGKEEEKPVDGESDGMLMPISTVSLSNDYGFGIIRR